MPLPNGASSAFVVVFNATSGHSNFEAARGTIEAACRSAGRPLSLHPVDDPRRLGEVVKKALSEAQAQGATLVASGGDGTLNTVAAAALGGGCAFGVLPGGTFNYFSRTHGIPADIHQALQLLLTEPPQEVQVGRVNDKIFLVNASLGLYPQLLEDREAWKRQLGRSRWVALGAGIATLLRGHRDLRLEFEAHGEKRQLRTPTLFVGNNALQMEQIGLDRAADIDAGSLAGITLKPVSRLTLLGLLGRGVLGRLGEADQVIDFSFRKLNVRAPRRPGASRIKVAIDGEISWMKLPLVFEVAPEPLRLIRPVGLAPERRAQRKAGSQAAEDSA